MPGGSVDWDRSMVAVSGYPFTARITLDALNRA